MQVTRIGLTVGMFAVPAFVMNDLLFDADALRATGPIRLAIMALMGIGILALSAPRIRRSPRAISAVIYTLYLMFSLGLAFLQAGHVNGFLVTVPGYVQVMIFIPVICFSLSQAVCIFATMFSVGVLGAMVAGASQVEVLNILNWLGGSSAFALGATYVVDALNRRAFVLEQDLSREKARSDELLLNILPSKIAQRLKNKEQRIADQCPCATVLFADIAGFTALSRNLAPGDLVDLLNDLFSRFDQLAEEYGVEKIKTIGDGYMAVAGLSQTRTADEAATAVADMALSMRGAFSEFRKERSLDLSLRIGLHSGPVVAGVIGVRKFAFDLWGDTVNVASRIEACSPPDEIQISGDTRDLIGDGFITASRGEVEIRGHEMREVFLLQGRATAPRRAAPGYVSGAALSDAGRGR